MSNEWLVERFISASLQGSLNERADRYCSPSLVLHDSISGQAIERERLETLVTQFRAAFSDTRLSGWRVVDDGEFVRSFWRWGGTHQGEFMGVPGTGKRVSVAGAGLWRVSGGKITEGWLMVDYSGFRKSLMELATEADRSGHPVEKQEIESDLPYEVIHVRSWGDFLKRVTGSEFRNWVFRGQEKACWPMLSSLSRYLIKHRIHRSVWSEQEERIARVFQRKAHLFLQHLPQRDDTFEWTGLMQHHGAPTRLLDVTWSPYVAAFFALEKADQTAAVWAIFAGKLIDDGWKHDLDRLPKTTVDEVSFIHPTNPREKGVFEKIFLPGTMPIVKVADPFVMNQRLTAQQGTFLVPGRLDEPVEATLASYPDSRSLLAKFVIHPEARDEAMRELLNMNITNATLFPGLDGLARSMMYELEFHYKYDPRTGEKWETPGAAPAAAGSR